MGRRALTHTHTREEEAQKVRRVAYPVASGPGCQLTEEPLVVLGLRPGMDSMASRLRTRPDGLHWTDTAPSLYNKHKTYIELLYYFGIFDQSLWPPAKDEFFIQLKNALYSSVYKNI